MNPLDGLDPYLEILTSLNGRKSIVVFLIMFGYMLKMVPKRVFPNAFIPMANCFVLGPLLSVVLLAWPGPGEITPDVRWPMLAAWCWAYQTGFLLGTIAWAMHGFVLKRIDQALKPKEPAPVQ